MEKILRDEVYCEEVGECPNKPDIAVFEVGCNKKDDYVYFICPRGEDVNGLADWLADMICSDCTNMCPAAQKQFCCDYHGQDFTAVAEVIANMENGCLEYALPAENTPF